VYRCAGAGRRNRSCGDRRRASPGRRGHGPARRGRRPRCRPWHRRTVSPPDPRREDRGAVRRRRACRLGCSRLFSLSIQQGSRGLRTSREGNYCADSRAPTTGSTGPRAPSAQPGARAEPAHVNAGAGGRAFAAPAATLAATPAHRRCAAANPLLDQKAPTCGAQDASWQSPRLDMRRGNCSPRVPGSPAHSSGTRPPARSGGRNDSRSSLDPRSRVPTWYRRESPRHRRTGGLSSWSSQSTCLAWKASNYPRTHCSGRRSQQEHTLRRPPSRTGRRAAPTSPSRRFSARLCRPSSYVKPLLAQISLAYHRYGRGRHSMLRPRTRLGASRLCSATAWRRSSPLRRGRVCSMRSLRVVMRGCGRSMLRAREEPVNGA
jgi:hypothetical protein